MSNLHRVRWFDAQVRAGKHPNSSRLAEQFEISQRQAQRDIDYMASSLGAPLRYVAKLRGYAYEDATYMLPSLVMTEQERNMLKFLAYRYEQYNYENATEMNRFAHLLHRMTEDGRSGSLEKKQMPAFGFDPERVQSFVLLQNAMEQKCKSVIHYGDAEGEIGLVIHPYEWIYEFDADYLAAYCEKSMERRMFRLDRIHGIAVMDMRFDIGTDKQAAASVGGAGNTRPKPFRARLRFNPEPGSAIWYGYAIERIEPFVYDIEFYDIPLFVKQLLCSEWSELLSPKWLKMKLAEAARAVLRRVDHE